MSITKEQIVEALGKMTLIELNELVKAIETTYEVSAAPVAGAMMMAPGAGAAAAAAPVEEKTEFTVVLLPCDAAAKIKVIKAVRSLTNLGLKEAKDLVEAAPKELLKDVSKDESEKARKEVEEAGGKVEIK